MKLDLLIVQIAIIFLPGLIWARLDVRYAQRSKPTDIEFVVRTFLFGITSYAVVFSLYGFAGWPVRLLSDFTGEQDKLVVSRDIAVEIAWATATGLLLSLLWIYASTEKWLTRFLKFIRATKADGDEDVWRFTFNSERPGNDYVHFRDFESKTVSAGWVTSFSEVGGLRELVLENVEVFDFDGNRLYDNPMVYLARPPEKIHIEFPYRPDQEGVS
ncbi:MAG: DUF6338 family protein [Rhodospirillaceae bacterium]